MVERAAVELIDATLERLGLGRQDVVTYGSSKGGTAALYFALRHRLGHAVAGGPQVRLGAYLIDQFPPYVGVAEYIAGGTAPEDREFLDTLLDRAAEGAAGTTLHLHVGRGDPHYERHVLPLVEAIDGHVPCAIDLGDYSTHGDLGVHFPEFVRRTFAALGIPVDPPPGP